MHPVHGVKIVPRTIGGNAHLTGDRCVAPPHTPVATAEMFDIAAQRLLGRASHDGERLAIRRAALAAAIDAMERIDDSFGEFWRAVQAPRARLSRAAAQLPRAPGVAPRAARARRVGGLRPVPRDPVVSAWLPEPEADLGYQLGKAIHLRGEVIAAAETFTTHPDL
jgi:hypothetical protein